MVDWEETAIKRVKEEWNRLLWVEIDYWVGVRLQIKR